MHDREVYRGECAKVYTFSRGAVDVGVVHCYSVQDAENLRDFRVLGLVVNQSLDQVAVDDADNLIIVQGGLDAVEFYHVAFAFEFITAHIGLVKNRTVYLGFAQEIGACEVGILEFEADGMVFRQGVECVISQMAFTRDGIVEQGLTSMPWVSN